MTAAEFFGRVRAAQALTEDFDEVVAEFGKGCPCKDPPLKSTGRAHLKSQTHEKAFAKAGGKFFGMTVRAALELPVHVVHVQGAQRIDQQADGGVAGELFYAENPAPEGWELDHFDEMEQLNQYDEDDADARRAQLEAEDEDLSDIVVGEE
jgi:hypothetical protein